jgi:hypothetical protein
LVQITTVTSPSVSASDFEICPRNSEQEPVGTQAGGLIFWSCRPSTKRRKKKSYLFIKIAGPVFGASAFFAEGAKRDAGVLPALVVAPYSNSPCWPPPI